MLAHAITPYRMKRGTLRSGVLFLGMRETFQGRGTSYQGNALLSFTQHYLYLQTKGSLLASEAKVVKK